MTDTDSDTYECPVDGCDYGESDDKTLAQVRGHVNSSSDDTGHVWQDVKHELLAEAEKRDAASEDDVEGDGEDDQSDPEDTDDTEMASQEEYEEQYSDASDGEDDASDGESDTSTDADGSGFTVPSVGASTVVLVLGVAVAGFLIWKLYSGGDAASDYEAPEESVDADSDDGGMAAVEAGTGGVEL